MVFSSETQTGNFQGDGFVIENNVIKGEERLRCLDAQNAGEIIFNALNVASEHIAQIDAITGKKKTFRDVKERSIRLAIWMQSQEIKPGDVISICSPAHPDIQCIIFATIFIGATYSAFPIIMDLKSARQRMHLIQPKIAFVDESKLDVLQEAASLENHACNMIVLSGDSHESIDSILKIPSSEEIETFRVIKDIDLESVSAIMPTSGSSGSPKFASYSYEKLMSWISFVLVNKELSSFNNITLVYLFPEWEVSFKFTIKYLLLEVTHVFHKEFDPDETSRIIEKYKVNTLISDTYTVMSYCQSSEYSKYNLESVSLSLSMGAHLPLKVIEKFKKIFPNVFINKTYGMTETGPLTSYNVKSRNPESQGTVIPNIQMKFVDLQTGATLSQNKVGEIRVKTPFGMTGYFKNSTATELQYDDEGWFRSGDQGYYDENGEIVIVGRLKDMIRYRSFDIHAASVEKTLLSHANIIEAAVVGIPHDSYVEQPVACIRKAQGSEVTEKDVLELTNDLGHDDIFKGFVIFVDQLPRTTNGKINKRILKEQVEKIYQSHN